MRPGEAVAHPVDSLLLVLVQHGSDGPRALVEIVAVAVVVAHDEAVDALPGLRWQVLVGACLVRERRPPAGARHLDRVENGDAGRLLEVGIVGVEVRPGVHEPDRFALAMHVREDQDVRVRRMVVRVDHVRLRRAPAAGEGDELRGLQGLPRKHHVTTIVKLALYAGEGGVFERLGEVQPFDAGAEDLGKRSNQSPAARKPPSTRMVSPVTKRAAGEAR
jgi:hypothetical protein